MPELSTLKRWSVKDYQRLGELGLLSAEERTELIDGHITVMAAKGTPHVTALHLLANALREQLGRSALVRTQDPIYLDEFSEPEPDLAIVQGAVLDYVEQHPRPEQIYLVAEVADSTLKQDRDVKDKIYARAGIPEYWVLDLKHRQLHLFRDPATDGYRYCLTLLEPNQAAPLAFPDLQLPLSSILPPR